MQLSRYPIPHSLINIVESIWAFESDQGLPSGSLNMSVANGKTKLLLTVGGSLTARMRDKPDQIISADSLCFFGVTTQPIHLSGQEPVRLISIEFAPGMACHVAGLALGQWTNAIESAEAVFGLEAKWLQRQLVEQADLNRQVNGLVNFLVQLRLRSTTVHPVVDYALAAIKQSHGLVNLKAVSDRTGYTQRYLDKQFLTHVGIPPKLFARIMRFQQTYRQLLRKPDLTQADLYYSYYDQAHYIHEFKQFSGYSPSAYLRSVNAFGELFYR